VRQCLRVSMFGAIVVLTVSMSACGDMTRGPWGPLAVQGPIDHADDAGLAGGELEIRDACVRIEGRDALLVWPSNRTSWDPDSQAILFEDNNGGRGSMELTEGTKVVLFGAGSRDFGSLREIDWVNPPAEECRADIRYYIHDVDLPGDLPS